MTKLMNRRTFLTALTGVVFAPVLATKALASFVQPPPAAPTAITFGCTSKAQAERCARYILAIDRAADDSVRLDYYAVQWYDTRTGRFHRTEPISS